jgi:hypothetical protein
MPQAPATVFSEGFENVSPTTTPVLVNAYTGPPTASQTYTADTGWITDVGCNGIVTSQASTDLTQCASSATLEALTAALGTFNGTPAATNHAWASTTTSGPAADLVELATASPVALGSAGRFVMASVNVAATTCTTAAPLLKLYLVDGAAASPAFDVPYNPCPVAVVSATSAYAAPRAVLVGGSSVGVRIVNATAGGPGNDHGLDDLKLLDATPKLDLALTSPVAPGATSRLTATITNTTDLAEKAGWSFTDALGGGLSVAALPNIASTCLGASVDALPGSLAIAASATLPAGVASCTVQVDVVAAPGEYANGPQNITARSGVDPPAAAATVTFQSPPPPPPPPAPDAKQGASVTIARSLGTVRVKVPGSSGYVDVSQLREVPLGSRIDTRKGRVTLTAEVDASTGQTQWSWFYDGIFDVAQTKGAKPILVATLAGGSFAGCAPRRGTGSRVALGTAAGAIPFRFAAKRSKRKVRRLWGQGKGSFRTAGRRSTATVRGTQWLVEDRCDGTLTRVKEGRVDVRDLRLRKTIQLRAGKRSVYLAKAP